MVALGACTSPEATPSPTPPASSGRPPSPVSSASPGQSSSTISKDDFARQANAICETLNNKILALPRGNDAAGEADYAEKAVVLTEESLKQLRAVPTPPADVAAINNFYAKLDNALAVTRRYVKALRSGITDANAERAVNELALESNRLIAEANSAAIAYGLTICGQG